MRLHNLLEMMPGCAFVHIEDYHNELIFRGNADDALKRLKDGKVFTFFSMIDYEYASVLYISLEEENND